MKYMKKFMVIYYAKANFMDQAKNRSSEEMKAGKKQWMDWADGCEIEVHEMMPIPS